MATFESQIISLTGITSNATNQGYIDSWLELAAKDVLVMMPKEALLDITSLSTLDSTNKILQNVDEVMILHAMRAYTNKPTGSKAPLLAKRYRDCRKVSYRSVSLAEEDSGYLEACSAEDPVYYIFQNNLHVLPECTNAYPAEVSYVAFPKTIAEDPFYGREGIDNFPDELEQAVVYRASANAARFLFQDEQDDDIYVPMIKDLTNQFANSIKLYLSKFKKEGPVSEENIGSGGLIKALTKAMGGK
tara:strand:+ start:1395 stop:2132 length:738 start_codon:yes stop_codon:yes gene_type:complete